MQKLFAFGGTWVHHDHVGTLERSLDQLCDSYNFPQDEEFKWSPFRKDWMYHNLRDERREQFFLDVLRSAAEYNTKANLTIVDVTAPHLSNVARSPEHDGTILFMENVAYSLRALRESGVMIVDRPGGGFKDQFRFMSDVKELLIDRSKYREPREMAINVLCGESHFIRLLQLADVITSCITAFVAGERTYSPSIAEAIKPLLFSYAGSIGGLGTRIHPDVDYLNLYHWLFGDNTRRYLGQQEDLQLPSDSHRYFRGPDEP